MTRYHRIVFIYDDHLEKERYRVTTAWEKDRKNNKGISKILIGMEVMILRIGVTHYHYETINKDIEIEFWI